MYFIIFHSILIILCSSIVKSQESCQTPRNEQGSCIPIDNCRPIADLIADVGNSLSPYLNNFLQKSFCGLHDGVHYVCCTNEQLGPRFIPDDVPEIGKIENISNHPNLNLLPTKCGQVIADKISNGNKTAINELPFMALLRYETTDGFAFNCGGTIINKRYILTAAHCVSDRAGPVVSVRVGEHDRSNARDCAIYFGNQHCAPPVDDIEVEEVIAHPQHNRPSRFANDIALIRLRRDINLKNSNMKAICLPITNETQYAQLVNVTTAGWGLIDNDRRSDILLKALLPVVDHDTCQNQYGSIRIFESLLCAGGVSQIDTCQGDSGGPVFFIGQLNKNSIRYVQYGVVSAGHRSCGKNGNTPGIYTRTSYYMKWILDQLH